MTECEKTKQVLKEHLKEIVEWLEKGHSYRVTGGGRRFAEKRRRIIDDNCDKIARKLISLGYDYNTNHTQGYKEYIFLKWVDL